MLGCPNELVFQFVNQLAHQLTGRKRILNQHGCLPEPVGVPPSPEGEGGGGE